MKKNIVLIQTVENVGTGILYPCHYDNAEKNCKSYIIFTNRHVLDDLRMMEIDKKNMKDSIILQIYDDSGKLVQKDFIRQVLIHKPILNGEKKNDIAAILVDIDECVSITLQTKICQEEITDRSVLYMEGYPGVMLDDDVSQKVQMQGISKSIFPEHPNIGVYQISDDYHWYNDLKDLKLMQGFSGSPVYMRKGDAMILVGMNQSVADVENGENPFKLVYYLKMKYVLESLRKSKCILFRLRKDGSYQIEWIYGLKEELINYKNNPTLLVIGGSGAGKSSFAKDFALNGEKICVTNDGQTTRTNVIYEYSILGEQSVAEVRFLNQKDFKQRMEKLYGISPMLHYYHELFEFSETVDLRDNMQYLRKMYYFVESLVLREQCEPEWFGMLQDVLFQDKELDEDELWEIYENVLEFVTKRILVKNVKYICDREYILEVISTYQEDVAYEKCFRDKQIRDKEKLITIIKNKWADELEDELLEVILQQCCSDEFDYKKYQRACAFIFTQKANMSEIEIQNIEWIRKLWEKEEFRKNVLGCIARIEGFFDVNEFGFLRENGDERDKLWDSKLQKEDEKNIEKEHSKKIRVIASSFCNELHRLIKERLLVIFNEMQENALKVTFDLENLTKEKHQWLTRCLQSIDGESLTGIVKSVKIKDAISNEYALLLKELKIRELRILDTYGLDHVEWGKGARNVLHDIRYRYEEEEKIRIDDVGILYLKKLDSGRPEELRVVLPCVYEVMPQAPVYCVFSGIDIFYTHNLSEIENIHWKEENANACPKAVQYILSAEGKEEIIRGIECRQERKENFYRVLKNNLVPYCGRKELVQSHYAYYCNNLKYVQRILSSIIMKEYSSLEIVNVENVKNTLKEERGKAQIEGLLGKLFERASVRFWRYHHMTIKANYTRIALRDKKNKEYGHWGVNHLRWDQLFHEAYRSVMSNESTGVIQLFDTGKEAIQAALLNMERDFLGCAYDLYAGKSDDKHPFRRILEKMYRDSKIYENNPFEEQQYVDESTTEEKRRYLEDVVNFAKGFWENVDVRNEFIDFFIETFIARLEQENREKATNLVDMDLEFRDSLKKLEKEFCAKYGDMNEEADVRFYEILKYSFERRGES